MLDPFILRALAAGIGVALIAGPLGCFVVWRRMAYLGDGLSHAALLGVALGLLLGIDLTLGVAATTGAVAVLVVVFQQQRRLAGDTLLGLFAHAALASGLVALSFVQGVRVDLLAYLFGDLLAVQPLDLLWIYGFGALALAALAFIWQPLLLATVSEEVARAEGVSTVALQLALMLSLAVLVALGMKLVGVLLVTALLIVPAAASRPFARTPEAMALISSVMGAAAVAGGLALSLGLDTPTGPSVVVFAVLIFLASQLRRS